MNWPMVRLGDLGQWFGGGTPSKARSDFWQDGTVPWLSPKDMGHDVLSGTQDLITQAAVEGSAVRRVPAGSVAIVVRSGILERTLPIAVVPFETTLNQDMKALSPHKGVESSWVAWALRSREQRILSDTRKAGTTVASIEFSRLLRLQIPLPDVAEQRRIVAILEEHLSDLDDAQQSLRRAGLRLGRLQRAHWRKVFMRIESSNVPLLDVARIENGQTPRGLLEALSDGPGPQSVPYYKVGDMNAADGRSMAQARYYLDRADAERLKVRVRPAGTVLLPKRGGAIATNKKRVLAAPAAYDLNTMGLRPNERLRSDYLWHWLQGIDLGSLADGSNVPQLNAPQMRSLSLPLPDLAQQDRACEELDSLELASRLLRRSLIAAERRAGHLRMAILAAAFSGLLTGHVADSVVIEEMAEDEST